MSAGDRTRLTALFVNHDSGAWTQRAVESLRLEWHRDGRADEDLDVIVVDSGSREGEGTWLRSLEAEGARVLACDENVGYATGLNRAFAASSGAPDDVVALLNPDLYFLPGSLRPLLERLEQAPGVGLVAPRSFVDEARTLHLPPNELPSAWLELADQVAARVPSFGRRLAGWRSRRAMRWWGSDGPEPAAMLSGACLFARRAVIEELGAPMDGRYPLYFEDADLCARLARAGYWLELVPEAELLHHWSRSAGPDFEGEVADRWETSRALFMKTHQGGWSAACARLVQRCLAGWLERRAVTAIHPLTDLGVRLEPPSFELERRGSYQLEVSLTPHWGLSAGALFEGDELRLSERTWSWLFPGTYYARAVDSGSGEVVGAWRFEKTLPARSWPLDPDSLPRPRVSPSPVRGTGHGERVG